MALINKEQEYQDQEAWSNDVQKLKSYKEFAERVEQWNNKNDKFGDPVIIGSYEIVFDDKLGWCVDVDGDVSFYSLNITEIPFQFRNVIGWFDCYSCKNLTSLKGCPIYVGGWFDCRHCPNINYLEGCPKEVDGDFYCYNCGKKFKEEYIRSLCNVKGRIDN